jgi:hypothetical protein
MIAEYSAALLQGILYYDAPANRTILREDVPGGVKFFIISFNTEEKIFIKERELKGNDLFIDDPEDPFFGVYFKTGRQTRVYKPTILYWQ